MFFGLTNFAAIFQTMINEILQNWINNKEVKSFINDFIVETEKEKGHDKVVEEIVYHYQAAVFFFFEKYYKTMENELYHCKGLECYSKDT